MSCQECPTALCALELKPKTKWLQLNWVGKRPHSKKVLSLVLSGIQGLSSTAFPPKRFQRSFRVSWELEVRSRIITSIFFSLIFPHVLQFKVHSFLVHALPGSALLCNVITLKIVFYCTPKGWKPRGKTVLFMLVMLPLVYSQRPIPDLIADLLFQ